MREKPSFYCPVQDKRCLSLSLGIYYEKKEKYV